jgi:hypothetical protein
MDLADLRLPDPKRPPHKEPFPAAVPRAAVPWGTDEDDATRPHALVAALRTRPAKPAHAVQPPAPGAPSPRPATPVEPPVRNEPAVPVRRNQELHKHGAYLSLV